MNDPYAPTSERPDPEARPELDAEDRALEAMERAGGAALLAGIAGLVALPLGGAGGFLVGRTSSALLGALVALGASALIVPLGGVAVFFSLRARRLGEPHALSPSGAASGALWIGAVDVLLGLLVAGGTVLGLVAGGL